MGVRVLGGAAVFAVGWTIGCAVLAVIFIAAVEEGIKSL